MKKLLLAVVLVAVGLLIYRQVTRKSLPSLSSSEGVRIISLSPTLTEVLFELGEGERIVGVTNYCTFPLEARAKAKVGDLVNPDLERIAQLQPTIIFAEQWSSTKIVSRLRNLGLKVTEVPSPRSIEEIYRLIESVGEQVGKAGRAREIVSDMSARILAVKEKAARFEHHPTIYIEIDIPSWSVGRASYTHEAVTLCGARNLLEDVDKPALLVSQEIIIQRNPEVILSFEASAEQIRKRPGWGVISAVQRGWIIDHFNRDLLSRGNFRLVQGMEDFQSRLESLLKKKARSSP